jgi:hypothetical protein
MVADMLSGDGLKLLSTGDCLKDSTRDGLALGMDALGTSRGMVSLGTVLGEVRWGVVGGLREEEP